jgi:chromosome partitioning protein
MRTFALIGQKGGSGKSTLARQLSVLASESSPSLLIDHDPQLTTTKWWQRRQSRTPTPPEPALLELDGTTLTSAVAALRQKPGVTFVDTRPAVGEPEAEAARVADLVVVPCRPSPDDLEAIAETLKILRRLDRRAVVIINAAKSHGRARDARAALARYPVAVCPTHIADRSIYLDAALDGLGVGEMKGAAARDALSEIRDVWSWLLEVADDERR